VKGRIATGFHRTTCSIEAFALGLAVATAEADIKRKPAKGGPAADGLGIGAMALSTSEAIAP
jgi:hypothetical protein